MTHRHSQTSGNLKALGITLNASGPRLPRPGPYPLQITDASLRKTAAGDLQLSVEFKILGTSPSAGLRLHRNYSIQGPSPSVEAAGKEALTRLMEACGLSCLEDTSELQGARLIGSLGTRVCGDGVERATLLSPAPWVEGEVGNDR